MTFPAFEEAASTGEPIELYQLAIGSTVYFFNSSEDDYTFAGDIYVATPISRTAVSISGEPRQDNLTVELPASLPFPQLFVLLIPGQKATMTVLRLHRPDSALQSIVVFKGTVQSVTFLKDGVSAQLIVSPLSHALAREVPRYGYQGLCNHFLYDARCKIAQSSFQYTDSLTTIVSNVYTIFGLGSAHPDGWATGGFIQTGSSDFRLVIKHVGDDVTLILPFPDVLVGQNLDVFAGCDHTIAVCKSKFNNVINYGGFAFVPLKNIFSTGLV